MPLVPFEPKSIKIGATDIKAVYLGDTQVRPAIPSYLCFTANTAESSFRLIKNGSSPTVSLEISTDGRNWNAYPFVNGYGNPIVLSNIGDKVYFRNTSETDTNFSTSSTNYYQFLMSSNLSVSGDVTYLLNKNGTTKLSNYCFYGLFASTTIITAPELPATTLASYCYNKMFQSCASLTTAPSLPATTVPGYSYGNMFTSCTNLEEIPALPATGIDGNGYREMFRYCSKIKISSSQTGEYQTAYRIPTTGTGTAASGWNTSMFNNTGGTFKSNPSINTTYYTSNTVV